MSEPFLSTEYDNIYPKNEHLFNCAFFSKYYHSNNSVYYIVQDERVQFEDNRHINNDGRYIYDILIHIQVIMFII